MSKIVARRTYTSISRRDAAQATRKSILDVARRLFLQRGYVVTTMPAIAEAAGVAMDTVYATVGKKSALLRLLIEMAISGSDDVVPAEERDYVRAIRAESDAARKLEIYAAALRSIHARLAPLFWVLQGAAHVDPELSELWQSISRRRASNMRLFAEDLYATGRLRKGLSVDKAADVIWSMNSPEFYLLLVEERGWPPEEFEHWIVDMWRRFLLEV